MNTSFSISETLSTAWAIAKKNAWIVMGFTAVQFVVMFVFTTIMAFFLSQTSATGTIIENVSIQLVDTFIAVAMYQVFFKLLDDEGEIEFPDFVPNFLKAINFLLVKLD